MTDKEIKKNEVSLISKDKVSMNILTKLNESQKDERELLINAETNFSDIMLKYDLTVIHCGVGNGTYVSICPFCEREMTFCVSNLFNCYYCLACKEQGGIVDFVQKLENISRDKAIKGLEKNVEIKYATISDLMKYKKKSS